MDHNNASPAGQTDRARPPDHSAHAKFAVLALATALYCTLQMFPGALHLIHYILSTGIAAAQQTQLKIEESISHIRRDPATGITAAIKPTMLALTLTLT